VSEIYLLRRLSLVNSLNKLAINILKEWMILLQKTGLDTQSSVGWQTAEKRLLGQGKGFGFSVHRDPGKGCCGKAAGSDSWRLQPFCNSHQIVFGAGMKACTRSYPSSFLLAWQRGAIIRTAVH